MPSTPAHSLQTGALRSQLSQQSSGPPEKDSDDEFEELLAKVRAALSLLLARVPENTIRFWPVQVLLHLGIAPLVLISGWFLQLYENCWLSQTL